MGPDAFGGHTMPLFCMRAPLWPQPGAHTYENHSLTYFTGPFLGGSEFLWTVYGKLFLGLLKLTGDYYRQQEHII